MPLSRSAILKILILVFHQELPASMIEYNHSLGIYQAYNFEILVFQFPIPWQFL